ncbi:Sugar tr domain containing protein [Trichuris trichiura]|uniref:Sugar tr domain containing protein n=1 Tax=Trichuris trichiura TaxID=36087 RepID=A0A077YXL1_TRITR|nr:Sugar tr domain containing protein [Trichuris trichiura]
MGAEAKSKLTETPDIESTLYCGAYQVAAYAFFQLCCFTLAANMAYMLYAGLEPKWTCETEDGSNRTNVSLEDQCKLFESGRCSNITWHDVSFYPIVVEWGLICSKRSIIYIMMTIQMVGLLVGTPLVAQMSDSWGRRPLIAGVAGGFTQRWEVLATCMFLTGFFGGGLGPIIGVYLVENIIQKHRLLLFSIAGFNIGLLYAVLVAFLTQHWRLLVICSNSIGLLALVIIGLLKESPRWLVQSGKDAQARKAYLRILRVNQKMRHRLNTNEWEAVVEGTKRAVVKKRSFWHLFGTAKLATYTLVMSVSMFSLSSISTTLLYSLGDLSGNIYLNSTFYSLIRWSVAVTASLIDRFVSSMGRKHIIVTCTFVVLVCHIGLTVCEFLGVVMPKLTISLVFTAAAATSPIWNSISLVVVELYPTSMRSIAPGFMSIFIRAASGMAPQLLYLARVWKPGPWFINMILSACFLLGFTLKIPETKGKALPEESQERKISDKKMMRRLSLQIAEEEAERSMLIRQ